MKAKKAHTFTRAADDWYVEPILATRKLAAVEGFNGPIHDPSCGGGHIPIALTEMGYLATGSDLRQRVATGTPWFVGTSDFLDPAGVGLMGAPNCVMNPPYFKSHGIEAFTRRAVVLAPGKVCVFVEARFLFGQDRARGFYADLPPDRIWYVTPRPSCPPGEYLAAGKKAKNGSPDYVWLVWDEREGQARGGWLR